MQTQKLYDLLVEADWKGTEMDLEHCAFLLESFPGIDWLRPIIQADAPRLASIMDPPGTPVKVTEALTRCLAYDTKEGYAFELAKLIAIDRGRCLLDGGTFKIQRKLDVQVPQALPTTTASVEQRLYEAITAMSYVDTDDHVCVIGELLRCFGAKTLDIATLSQDAPRVAAIITEQPQFEFSRVSVEHKSVYANSLTSGLLRANILVRMYSGVVQDVARLLLELFAARGATSVRVDNEAYEQAYRLLDSGTLPEKLQVKRATSFDYTCLYAWMIEDHYGSRYGNVDLKLPLVDSAKNWDRRLVETVLQPLVDGGRNGNLLKFVVCVANNRDHAKALAERYAKEWRLYSQGHLSAQLDARDARHVVLLHRNERPRSIFVWGGENHYRTPDDWRLSALDF